MWLSGATRTWSLTCWLRPGPQTLGLDLGAVAHHILCCGERCSVHTAHRLQGETGPECSQSEGTGSHSTPQTQSQVLFQSCPELSQEMSLWSAQIFQHQQLAWTRTGSTLQPWRFWQAEEGTRWGLS